MRLTRETKKRILAAIKQRVPDAGACPLCRSPHWTLAEGLVFLVLQEQPAGQEPAVPVSLGGSGLPCAAIICTNCGNTHLLNLLTLGLAELFEASVEVPSG